MDEFDEHREKGNLTAELLNREKVRKVQQHLYPIRPIHVIMIWILYLQEECFEALESISRKINTNDADMRSHVILSMIKVAAAEADVPELPPSGSGRASGLPVLVLVFNVLLIHVFTMSISHMMTSASKYRTCQYLWRIRKLLLCRLCYYEYYYYNYITHWTTITTPHYYCNKNSAREVFVEEEKKENDYYYDNLYNSVSTVLLLVCL